MLSNEEGSFPEQNLIIYNWVFRKYPVLAIAPSHALWLVGTEQGHTSKRTLWLAESST